MSPDGHGGHPVTTNWGNPVLRGPNAVGDDQSDEGRLRVLENLPRGRKVLKVQGVDVQRWSYRERTEGEGT